MLKTNPSHAPRVFVMYRLNSMSAMTTKRNDRKHFPKSGFLVKIVVNLWFVEEGENLHPPLAPPIEGGEVTLRLPAPGGVAI